MKESIKNYIEYLTLYHGFLISIHGEGATACLDFLAPYNAHECGYCMYVKSSEECFARCKSGQKAAEKKAERDGAYFGSCYAGVGEFVFPIKAFGKCVGIVSVGGYVGSAEKRSAFAEKYGFREETLALISRDGLKPHIPESSLVKTLIEPLCAMLTLLLESGEQNENLYGRILSILHTGYMRKIKISDIADKLHYSESFISRTFRVRSGVTVNAYLTDLRIKKAHELLLKTDMRLEDIAASCGFSDTNYFISSFSKNYKISPKRYRNVNKR